MARVENAAHVLVVLCGLLGAENGVCLIHHQGGRSSSVIDRTTAAVLAFTVMSGWWQTASATSINRDFPQRFSGEVGVSRGACSHAGWARVAAHHLHTTASWASADGNTTYLPNAACVGGGSDPRQPLRPAAHSGRSYLICDSFTGRLDGPSGLLLGFAHGHGR
jgi:hypothetical protein